MELSFALEPLLDALAGFARKIRLNGLRQVVRMFLGGLTQKTNLPAIPAAPFAHQQMQPEAKSFTSRECAVHGFGLQAGDIPATGNE
jgi:hypothetical protein